MDQKRVPVSCSIARVHLATQGYTKGLHGPTTRLVLVSNRDVLAIIDVSEVIGRHGRYDSRCR